jgi:hypothetical protein
MVSPINHFTATHQADTAANAVQKPSAENPPAQSAKSQPARVQDSVSLKSTSDADHDGDTK